MPKLNKIQNVHQNFSHYETFKDYFKRLLQNFYPGQKFPFLNLEACCPTYFSDFHA